MATCGVLNISDATAVLNARECRSGSLPAHLYYLTGRAGVNTRRILKSGLLLPAGQRGIARAQEWKCHFHGQNHRGSLFIRDSRR